MLYGPVPFVRSDAFLDDERKRKANEVDAVLERLKKRDAEDVARKIKAIEDFDRKESLRRFDEQCRRFAIKV